MKLIGRPLAIAGVVLGLGLWGLPESRADDIYTIVVKKQEEKAKSRWSLSEWIDTRDRMRMMDLWLALHSPTPFEFFISGDWRLVDRTNSSPGSVTQSGANFGIAGYATIFGLEGRYESLPDLRRIYGLFRLRLFGFHVQGTHILLSAGARNQASDSAVVGESFGNFVYGVDSAIYLMKYFGIDGGYQWVADSRTLSDGSKVSGSRWELGAFIDFRFFRVFGKYLADTDERRSPTTTTRTERRGPLFGIKIFF